jgi:hypothetical protein
MLPSVLIRRADCYAAHGRDIIGLDAIRVRNTKLLAAYQKHITRANMSL